MSDGRTLEIKNVPESDTRVDEPGTEGPRRTCKDGGVRKDCPEENFLIEQSHRIQIPSIEGGNGAWEGILFHVLSFEYSLLIVLKVLWTLCATTTCHLGPA
eukprot:1905364-Pyramimonas_sp.AAC.1